MSYKKRKFTEWWNTISITIKEKSIDIHDKSITNQINYFDELQEIKVLQFTYI